jgi:hypothetical protein
MGECGAIMIRQERKSRERTEKVFRLVGAALAFFSWGCRSKAQLRVETVKGAESPGSPVANPSPPQIGPASQTSTVKATTIPGSSQAPRISPAQRTYFQTRSGIKITVESVDPKAGDEIQVSPAEQSDWNLLAAVVPNDWDVPREAATRRIIHEDSEFSVGTEVRVQNKSNSDLIVWLATQSWIRSGKLSYGRNSVLVSLRGGGQNHEVSSDVYLRDFPYSGMSSVASPIQSGKGGEIRYVGGMAKVAGSLVYSGQIELVVGTVGILNR